MGGKFKFQDTVPVLRKVVTSNTINFLIGSGYSYPPLMPQGNISFVLGVLKPADPRYLRVKAYLLWNYFLKSIYPLNGLNLDVSPQKEFTHAMKAILSNPEIKLLTKQINVFTTNFDPLFELGFDKKDNIHYNDGMEARLSRCSRR
jgi:hypothetical protein